MTALAAYEGTVLHLVEDPEWYYLTRAIEEASRRHSADFAYRNELDAWSGRRFASEGVPAANSPAPDGRSGALPGRAFASPELTQAAESGEADDKIALLMLCTASDDRMSRLRAGEATSAVLLSATSFGLAVCPLTEPLELPDVREQVRERVAGDTCPQMVLRIGWAPVNADPLPATPRRELADVLAPLGQDSTRYQHH